MLKKLFDEEDLDTSYKTFQEIKGKTRDSEVWLSLISKLTDEETQRKLFKELFSIPRPGLEQSWKFYETWEKNAEEKKKTQSLYLNTLADWLQEQEISAKFSNLQKLSMSHIKALHSHTKPSVHPYIFEESLYRSPNSADIWEAYIISQLSNPSNSKKLCKRSLRSNPSCTNLWSLLFLSYETQQKLSDSNFYIEILNKALSQPFDEASSYTRLWKEYSLSLQRIGKDPIPALIQGEHWLKSYCPPQHLVLKAARGTLTKDLALFEEIVKEQSTSYTCWEVYLKFLESESNDALTREVYLRALDKCADAESIILKFNDWEQRCGDTQSVIQCKIKTQQRKMRDLEQITVKTEKFKMKSKEVKTRFTAFISNLPGSVKEYQLDEVLRQLVRVKAVRIVRDRKGNSRGIAYCDFESIEDLDYAVNNLNNAELFGNKVEVAVSKPPESEKNEERTVFVNNLPFTCSEINIRNALECFGKIQAVRVIKNAEGKCKGYAYVEFSEKDSVDIAVAQGSVEIDKRRVLIERYHEVKEQKFVLHVSNLPFDVTEKELLQAFPSAVSANCPVDRSGRTRGFGFVEFQTEADAQTVLEQPNPIMNGRHSVVKRSYKKPAEKKLNNSDFKKFLL